MENILQNIIDGLNSWTNQILDIEERIKKTKDIRKSVVDSLTRQVLDGFISEKDSIELEHNLDLWLNLYNAVLCKTVGVDFSNRDILTHLVDLFSLKQISTEFLIDVLIELCHKN